MEVVSRKEFLDTVPMPVGTMPGPLYGHLRAHAADLALNPFQIDPETVEETLMLEYPFSRGLGALVPIQGLPRGTPGTRKGHPNENLASEVPIKGTEDCAHSASRCEVQANRDSQHVAPC